MNNGVRRAKRTARRSRQVVLIIALACAVPPLTSAQEARLFVSSRAGDRLTEKRAVRFTSRASGPATFRLILRLVLPARSITTAFWKPPS